MSTGPNTLTSTDATSTDATDIDATSIDGHVATVSALYGAFGRGDVATILDALDEDIAWESWADHFAQRAGVAHFAPRRGPAQVAEFFALLSTWTVQEFTLLDVLTSDRQVVAEVRLAFDLPGGGRFRDEELHLWTFGADGKVTAVRHYGDTAKHIAADRGEDTRRG